MSASGRICDLAFQPVVTATAPFSIMVVPSGLGSKVVTEGASSRNFWMAGSMVFL